MFQPHRFFLSAALLVAACGGPPDGFTQAEWDTVKTMSPLPAVPADPTNKYADDLPAARLGQVIFFEKAIAGPIGAPDPNHGGALGAQGEVGKVACSDCHLPSYHYCDNRTTPNNLSLGANIGKRNSPSVLDVAYYDWFTWAGRLDTLWTQGASAIESPDMAGNRCRLAHYLWDHQKDAYNAVFTDTPLPASLDGSAASPIPSDCKPNASGTLGDNWLSMSAADQQAVAQIQANVGKAIAAYERHLVSGPSPFDRYVAGDGKAMSDSAKRGLKLFIGKAFCVQCHSGPVFSDQQFHNLGVPQSGPGVPTTDTGRYDDIQPMQKNPFNGSSQFSDDQTTGAAKIAGIAPQDSDMGAFRTKDLRGVAGSAPYMHDGVFATLADVVEFYDQGGGANGFVGTKDVKIKALNLTDSEKADLVAFLEALSGDDPPADWGAP